MTTAAALRGAAILIVALVAGCGGVSRRFVIESNVPNAQVFIDDKPIGPAPAHSQFEYYGFYNITLVQPGYETQSRRVHVVAPWYAYPPFDFLAGFWPFGIEDVRRYYFELCPSQQIRTDQLISNADALRERGWALPLPKHPAPPPTPKTPAAQPAPLPQPLPNVQPQPGVPSVVPSVTPSGYSTSPRLESFLR